MGLFHYNLLRVLIPQEKTSYPRRSLKIVTFTIQVICIEYFVPKKKISQEDKSLYPRNPF